MPHSSRLLNLYRRLVTHAVQGVGVYAVATGLLTLFGGEDRVSAPIYFSIHQLWDPLGLRVSAVLGLTLLLWGLLTLGPWLRVSQFGLLGVAVWSLYLGISFIISVLVQPLAGFPGLTSQVFLAVMSAGLAAVRRADREGWPDGHTEPSPPKAVRVIDVLDLHEPEQGEQ